MIRVIFFGTDKISTPTLQALIASPKYEVVAVVTKPDTARGRGHKMYSPEVARLAHEHDITCLQPTKLSQITDRLAKLRPDIGALVAYGKIIPRQIIDLFPHGIINFHPSMLPVYRGPSPIETAIMHGDKLTGLSLMKLSAEMDAGDIFYQEPATIAPDETARQLYDRFAKRGAELMVDKLDQITRGKLTGVSQDDNLAVYCHMITPEMGRLDPHTMTARECYDRLRAFDGWPKCHLALAGTDVIVTKLKPLDQFRGDSWQDIVPCRSGSALQVIELISPKSGRRMSVTDFLNGQHSRSN